MRYYPHLLEQLLYKIGEMLSAGEDVEEKNSCRQLMAMWIRTSTKENSMERPPNIKNITMI